LFAITPDRAAEEVVQVATDPKFKNIHGRFLQKGEEVEHPKYAIDADIQQRLWEISEKLTDATYLGPNYDPTGSIAMYSDREIPKGLIRPVEDPTRAANGVVKRV
jgi:hypothetical protein